MTSKIIALDLNLQGIPRTIASFLIPHNYGVILVESGPGSTLPELERGLATHGYSFVDISDVLLTHIHLDHAGAAGWLAQQGAQVYVHEVGAPHMLNPEKLIKSATRVYGDLMDTLWGKFLPVPEEKLTILTDGAELDLHGLSIQALDTPGHACHHLAYRFEDICFTGDVGGVRLPGPSFLHLPTPPPEFHIESWRESIAKLKAAAFKRIAPTHFGIYDDVNWHLDALDQTLDEVEQWLEAILPTIYERPALQQPFADWEYARCEAAGLDEATLHAYSLAMPLGMGADGIWRYWDKFRTPQR
jgi:glyoxylase-like metal-dependent hydrolase (beta-lactamase superfamily II)